MAEVVTIDKDRLVIKDSHFYREKDRVWLNGVNAPWFSWNDFGDRFDRDVWEAHFCALESAYVNACRVWICCNGDVGIQIDEAGFVTGATQKHWDDLDQLMEIAKKHRIYIMATVMSFDHFKDSHKTFERWRKFIRKDEAIDSFCDYYLKPLVGRYKSNPYFWSIDLLNEPDWITNSDFGDIEWKHLCNYFARASVTIHEWSAVHVTVGLGRINHQSDDVEGNKLSDHVLRVFVNNPLATMDFYSPHYYSSHTSWRDRPFDAEPATFGLLDAKPCVIGECMAKSSGGSTLSDDYIHAYKNNWDGVFAWSSNGVDACGGFDEVSAATRAFKQYLNGSYTQVTCLPDVIQAGGKKIVRKSC